MATQLIPVGPLAAQAPHTRVGTFALLFDLFKLRIGLVIGLTALAGIAITPGRAVPLWQIAVLFLATVASSAAAGAFNQYVERDLDARMQRTRGRPFVTGALRASAWWPLLIGAITVAAVALAAIAVNAMAALYVFLGAFFYAVVYTVWLKRRTWLNIVIGGLAGSFAVLAGAATVTPALSAEALWLALVLFLWTPPHFWSLAILCERDYAAARVPMLPVVVGVPRCARIIFWSTLVLVAASFAPIFYGAGWIYFCGAMLGGTYFVWKSLQLALAPDRKTAAGSFHASLLQLSLLILAAMLEAAMK